MDLFRQTIELQKRILGDEHPNTLLSMSGLAGSYYMLGQYQEAMEIFKPMLELQKRI